MDSVIAKMTDYSTRIKYDDLPQNVVHQMKRCILDSIGCAFIGQTSDRGKIAAELAAKLGGPAEATIFGRGDKVACTGAAFANGEAMNALDYDALSAAAVHDVPVIIPAMLALAESTNATGKELILASALGFELSARLKAAGAKIRLSDGGDIKWPAVLGYAAVTLAAAAGASKLLGLDIEKTANAIAIAGGINPPNIFKKFTDTTPIAMIKYASTGWEAQAAITAAMLAQGGYLGNTDIFAGNTGYYRYMGMGDISEEAIVELMADLGTNWRAHQVNYKQYPCCGHLASVVDALYKIIDENDIKPGDIESIVVHLDSISQFRIFQQNDMITPDDYAFSAPYIFACTANRLTRSRWHETQTKNDPAIGRFIDRVNVEVIPNEKVAGMSKHDSMENSNMNIAVSAKGHTFEEKITYMKGSWEPGEFSNTDDELATKFADNTSNVLSTQQANKAAESILAIDDVKSISEVIELLKS